LLDQFDLINTDRIVEAMNKARKYPFTREAVDKVYKGSKTAKKFFKNADEAFNALQNSKVLALKSGKGGRFIRLQVTVQEKGKDVTKLMDVPFENYLLMYGERAGDFLYKTVIQQIKSLSPSKLAALLKEQLDNLLDVDVTKANLPKATAETFEYIAREIQREEHIRGLSKSVRWAFKKTKFLDLAKANKEGKGVLEMGFSVVIGQIMMNATKMLADLMGQSDAEESVDAIGTFDDVTLTPEERAYLLRKSGKLDESYSLRDLNNIILESTSRSKKIRNFKIINLHD
jgi:hypothetical protein